MTKYARIEGGVVANVEEWGETPPAVTGVTFVTSETAVRGDLYAGGVFTKPLPPLAETKAAKKAAVMAYRDSIFNDRGYTVETGVMAGHVLQCRTTGEDRTNWLTSQGAYKAAIDAGAGAVIGAKFRTKANVNFDLTYDEGYAVILAMAAWGSLVVARAWALSDLIEDAADHAALDAIDIAVDWPV